MHRNRGPFSHVHIDDGEESDWDTVTEVNENKSKAENGGLYNESRDSSPRDDTSYYQPSSIDFPTIPDSNNPKDIRFVHTEVPERNEINEASSHSESNQTSSKNIKSYPANDNEQSLSDLNGKRLDQSMVTGSKANIDCNAKVAAKYATSTGQPKEPLVIQVSSNSAANSPSSLRSISISGSLIDKQKKHQPAMLKPDNEIPQKQDHSIAISDSGVDDAAAHSTESAISREDSNTKQQRKWNTILSPTIDSLKNKVHKKQAKFQAAIHQPADEEFDGENYFDLFKQSRFEYKFYPPPSGADFKFTLPRENPKPKAMRFVDKVENLTQKALAEIFSAIRIVFAIIIACFVEASKTIVGGLLQPLIVAVITILGSYFLQPILVAVFNHIIAPTLSFVHNVFSASFRSLQPFFNLLGQLFYNIAELVKSFRLVEVRSYGSKQTEITNEGNKNAMVGSLQPV